VLLVQIDERSIIEAGISDPHPMDRSYLAKIVDRLTSLEAQVIGIDYLFDRQQPAKDHLLARAVRNAIAENDTWFIFAGIKNKAGTEIGVSTKTGIADPHWSLQGYTNALPQYIKLPESTNCVSTCPFTYLLAIASGLHRESLASSLPQPKLNSQEDFRTQVIDYLNQIQTDNNKLLFLQRASPHPFAKFAQSWNRVWLRPIIDFSIPPDVVYDRLPAWELLAESEELANHTFERQIIIIAPGGYPQAGITPGADNFPVPLAVAYWRERFDLASGSSHNFTGSEANAYMIHHLLTQRLVIPIPALWAIAVAAFLGKGFILMFRKQYHQRQQWAIGLTGVTAISGLGLVGLQLYLSAGILLPWLLPSATFLLYVWFSLRSKYRE
nr:CHASE2 domain-containing protein [Pleurocapsa sp. MO_192.B19]